MYIIRNKNDAIWVYIGDAAIPFFSKILVVVLYWILLHGIVHNFACNILNLRDNIDINFASIAC